jgi:hypothetical protein
VRTRTTLLCRSVLGIVGVTLSATMITAVPAAQAVVTLPPGFCPTTVVFDCVTGLDGNAVTVAPDTGAAIPAGTVPTVTGTVPSGGDPAAGVSSDNAATSDATDQSAITEVSDDTSTVVQGETASGWCVTTHNDAYIQDAIHVHLASFNQSTYWCWNRYIVTYHSTSYTGSVTTTGSIGGWEYKPGDLQTSFHCYEVKGSTRLCSGNYEEGQGSFQACIYNICFSNWYPVLQMWEQYTPSWHYAWS